MAGTTTKSKPDARAGSQAYATTQQLNNLITAFDAVLAKLDADAGVTGTDYASLHGSTASKVGNLGGTVIS